jgi:uncharacterized protein YkwD
MSYPSHSSAGRRRWFSPCVLAALAACGGGGAATEAVEKAPSQVAADVITEPAATPASSVPASGSRATCGLADFEFEALARLNAYRAAGAQCGDRGAFAAAPLLTWNAPLSLASLAHSDDMVLHNFFAHTGSDSSSAGQRAGDAGYLWSRWGENIAAGQNSVQDVVAAWMSSPGHCANIMNAGFRDIGLACVNGGSGNAFRNYWTMTLGRAR